MHGNDAKTLLVTGGNAGLGFETAKAVLRANDGWHLLVTARDPAKGAAAVERLRRETGDARVEAAPLDLASLASVRRLAADLGLRLAAGELPPLRGVVANAGLRVTAGTTFTLDGFETTFGVNHLGHFLLLNLLVPRLSAPARIVTVGSGTHEPDNRLARLMGMPAPRWRPAEALAHPDRFPDPAERGESSATIGRRRYGTAKLAQIIATYELARRLDAAGVATPARPIVANVFDPGLMPGSGLARDAGPIQRWAWRRLLPALRVLPGVSSTARSGPLLARLLLDPAFEGVTGRYVDEGRERPSSPFTYDRAAAAALWDGSADLVGLAPQERWWSSATPRIAPPAAPDLAPVPIAVA